MRTHNLAVLIYMMTPIHMHLYKIDHMLLYDLIVHQHQICWTFSMIVEIIFAGETD